MKLQVLVVSLFCAGFFSAAIPGNSQNVTWPLTSSQTATSSSSTVVTGAPEVVSGGTSPTVFVFDYSSGVAQRLNAGSSGWNAGPVSNARYLQFDASPTSGNQLNVCSVSFNYGNSNVANQIHADVRYSTNNWSSSTVLATGLIYQAHSMTPFSSSISIPPIPSGGTFSLRIFPYAVIDSTAGAPTFAAHNSVVISGGSCGGHPTLTKLPITKSTGAAVIAGTYTFNISCNGPGGPYTGANPVSITLPGPGVTTPAVPMGDTCTVAETPISGWNTPVFSGGPAPVTGSGWSAQVGPIAAMTDSVLVTNRPVKDVPQVRLQISKNTGREVVAGTYTFNVSCTGPGGPYTGVNPVSVTLPGTGFVTTSVPQGDSCTMTETPIAGWGYPLFSSTPEQVNTNGWAANIAMNVNDTLVVTNQPKKDIPQVRLQITKSTGVRAVAGTYTFSVSCTGPGGPYTGTNPISITYPTPGLATTSVPQGDSCTVSETALSGWGNPSFASTPAAVTGSGWSANIAAMNVNNNLVVTNQPKSSTTFVDLAIDKSTGPTVVAGTYTFNISCTGPGGPYTVPNPVTITFPGSAVATTSVPSGDMCTISETPITGWNAPTFAWGSTPVAGSGWSAQVGPVTLMSNTAHVNNQPKIVVQPVRLGITKNTGAATVAGTYTFNIACSGPGGPYTGTNPISITLPGSGFAPTLVPNGDTCTVSETPITGWGTPIFTGSPEQVTGSGWSAQLGPINGGANLTVTNQPKPQVKTVNLLITKSTGAAVVPGTYNFNISCSGPGGPFTGTSSVTLPSSGPSVTQVPYGDTCTVNETLIAGWGNPSFAGSGGTLVPNGWAAQFGPLYQMSTLAVTNQPKVVVKPVRFTITKSTGKAVVPGTYTFNITCSGPGGPYTGTNPVSITLPGSGTATTLVPDGDTCTLSETPVRGWNTPLFSGSRSRSPAAGGQLGSGP